MGTIVYGTSDQFLNYAEILLLIWAKEKIGSKALFFHYPKGERWYHWEVRLFEPYEFEPYKYDSDYYCFEVEIVPLQEMLTPELYRMTLHEIAELIRTKRQIKTFRAINFPSGEKVYVSSKDKMWKEWARRTLGEVVNNLEIKIGGAFIYFLYGAWLAQHDDVVGILPHKQKPDVIGAFEVGAKLFGRANVFYTGEFDFMTAKQWVMWEKDRLWRKVPLSIAKKFLQTPHVVEQVRRRLIVEAKYTPLVYNDDNSENKKKFYLKEDLL